MAEARQQDQWNHTAVLWCLWANIHRDDKKRPKPYEVADIHPFAERKPEQQLTVGDAARLYGGKH